VVLMKISRFLLKTMSLLVISVLISFHLMLLKSLLLFLNQISDIFFALSLYLNDLLEYCVFLYVFVFVCVCVCVCVCAGTDQSTFQTLSVPMKFAPTLPELFLVWCFLFFSCWSLSKFKNVILYLFSSKWLVIFELQLILNKKLIFH
jgi:hypothetical protein